MADRDAQKMLSTANKLLDGLDAAAKAANQKTAEASAKALNEKLGAAHAGLPNGLVDKGYNPQKFQRTAVDSESDARACVEQLRNQGFDAVFVEHRGEYVIEVSNVPTAYDNYYQQHSSSNQSLLLQAAQQSNTPDLPYMNHDDNSNNDLPVNQDGPVPDNSAPNDYVPENYNPEPSSYNDPANYANSNNYSQANIVEDDYVAPVMDNGPVYAAEAIPYADNSGYSDGLLSTVNNILDSMSGQNLQENYASQIEQINAPQADEYAALQLEANETAQRIMGTSDAVPDVKDWMRAKEETAIFASAQSEYAALQAPGLGVPDYHEADAMLLDPLSLMEASKHNHETVYAQYELDNANLDKGTLESAYAIIRNNPDQVADTIQYNNGSINITPVLEQAVLANPLSQSEKTAMASDISTAVQAIASGEDVREALGLEKDVAKDEFVYAVVMHQVAELGIDVNTNQITSAQASEVQSKIYNEYGLAVKIEPTDVQTVADRPVFNYELPEILVQERFANNPVGEPVYTSNPYGTVEDSVAQATSIAKQTDTFTPLTDNFTAQADTITAQANTFTTQDGITYATSNTWATPEQFAAISDVSQNSFENVPQTNVYEAIRELLDENQFGETKSETSSQTTEITRDNAAVIGRERLSQEYIAFEQEQAYALAQHMSVAYSAIDNNPEVVTKLIEAAKQPDGTLSVVSLEPLFASASNSRPDEKLSDDVRKAIEAVSQSGDFHDIYRAVGLNEANAKDELKYNVLVYQLGQVGIVPGTEINASKAKEIEANYLNQYHNIVSVNVHETAPVETSVSTLGQIAPLAVPRFDMNTYLTESQKEKLQDNRYYQIDNQAYIESQKNIDNYTANQTSQPEPSPVKMPSVEESQLVYAALAATPEKFGYYEGEVSQSHTYDQDLLKKDVRTAIESIYASGSTDNIAEAIGLNTLNDADRTRYGIVARELSNLGVVVGQETDFKHITNEFAIRFNEELNVTQPKQEVKVELPKKDFGEAGRIWEQSGVVEEQKRIESQYKTVVPAPVSLDEGFYTENFERRLITNRGNFNGNEEEKKAEARRDEEYYAQESLSEANYQYQERFFRQVKVDKEGKEVAEQVSEIKVAAEYVYKHQSFEGLQEKLNLANDQTHYNALVHEMVLLGVSQNGTVNPQEVEQAYFIKNKHILGASSSDEWINVNTKDPVAFTPITSNNLVPTPKAAAAPQNPPENPPDKSKTIQLSVSELQMAAMYVYANETYNGLQEYLNLTKDTEHYKALVTELNNLGVVQDGEVHPFEVEQVYFKKYGQRFNANPDSLEQVDVRTRNPIPVSRFNVQTPPLSPPNNPNNPNHPGGPVGPGGGFGGNGSNVPGKSGSNNGNNGNSGNVPAVPYLRGDAALAALAQKNGIQFHNVAGAPMTSRMSNIKLGDSGKALLQGALVNPILNSTLLENPEIRKGYNLLASPIKELYQITKDYGETYNPLSDSVEMGIKTAKAKIIPNGSDKPTIYDEARQQVLTPGSNLYEAYLKKYNAERASAPAKIQKGIDAGNDETARAIEHSARRARIKSATGIDIGEYKPLAANEKLIAFGKRATEVQNGEIVDINVTEYVNRSTFENNFAQKLADTLKTDAYLLSHKGKIEYGATGATVFKEMEDALSSGAFRTMITPEELALFGALKASNAEYMTFDEAMAMEKQLQRYRQHLQNDYTKALQDLKDKKAAISSGSLSQQEKALEIKKIDDQMKNLTHQHSIRTKQVNETIDEFHLSDETKNILKKARAQYEGFEAIQNGTAVAIAVSFTSQEAGLASKILSESGFSLTSDEKAVLKDIISRNASFDKLDRAALHDIVKRYDDHSQNRIRELQQKIKNDGSDKDNKLIAKKQKLESQYQTDKAIIDALKNKIPSDGTVFVKYDLNKLLKNGKFDQVDMAKFNTNFLLRADQMGYRFVKNGKFDADLLMSIKIGSQAANDLGLTEETRAMILRINGEKFQAFGAPVKNITRIMAKMADKLTSALEGEEGGLLTDIKQGVGTGRQIYHAGKSVKSITENAISSLRNLDLNLGKKKAIETAAGKAKRMAADAAKKKAAAQSTKIAHAATKAYAAKTEAVAAANKLLAGSIFGKANAAIEGAKAAFAKTAVGGAIKAAGDAVAAAAADVAWPVLVALLIIVVIIAIFSGLAFVVLCVVSGMVEVIKAPGELFYPPAGLTDTVAYNLYYQLDEEQDKWVENLGDFETLHKAKDDLLYSPAYLTYSEYMPTVEGCECVFAKDWQLFGTSENDKISELWINPFICYNKADGKTSYDSSTNRPELLLGSYTDEGGIDGNARNPIIYNHPETKSDQKFQLGRKLEGTLNDGSVSIEMSANPNTYQQITREEVLRGTTISALPEGDGSEEEEGVIADNNLLKSLYDHPSAESGHTNNIKDIITLTDITYEHAMQDSDDATAHDLMGLSPAAVAMNGGKLVGFCKWIINHVSGWIDKALDWLSAIKPEFEETKETWNYLRGLVGADELDGDYPTYTMVTCYAATLQQMALQQSIKLSVNVESGPVATTYLPIRGWNSRKPYIYVLEKDEAGTANDYAHEMDLSEEPSLDGTGSNGTNIQINLDGNYFVEEGENDEIVPITDALTLETKEHDLCLGLTDSETPPAFENEDGGSNYGITQDSDTEFYWYVWSHGGSLGIGNSTGCWERESEDLNYDIVEKNIVIEESCGMDVNAKFNEEFEAWKKEIRNSATEEITYTHGEIGSGEDTCTRIYFDESKCPFTNDSSSSSFRTRCHHDDSDGDCTSSCHDLHTYTYHVCIYKIKETYVHHCAGHPFLYHTGRMHTTSTGIVYSISNEQQAMTTILEKEADPIVRYDNALLSDYGYAYDATAFQKNQNYVRKALKYDDFRGKVYEQGIYNKGSITDMDRSGRSLGPNVDPQGSFIGSQFSGGVPLLIESGAWAAGASVDDTIDENFEGINAAMPHDWASGNDAWKRNIKKFKDIFDADTYLDKGSNLLGLKEVTSGGKDGWKKYEGWTADSIRLACNKFVMDWNDVYKFDIPQNINGCVPYSEQDIRTIINSAGDDSKEVMQNVLPWVGKAHYAFDALHTGHDFLCMACGDETQRNFQTLTYTQNEGSMPTRTSKVEGKFQNLVSCTATTSGGFANFVLKSLGKDIRVQEMESGWITGTNSGSLKPGAIVRWKFGELEDGTSVYNYMIYLGTLSENVALDPPEYLAKSTSIPADAEEAVEEGLGGEEAVAQKLNSLPSGKPLFAKMVLAREGAEGVNAYTYACDSATSTGIHYSTKTIANGNFGTIQVVYGEEALTQAADDSVDDNWEFFNP